MHSVQILRALLCDGYTSCDISTMHACIGRLHDLLGMNSSKVPMFKKSRAAHELCVTVVSISAPKAGCVTLSVHLCGYYGNSVQHRTG